jgi:hypothetical protein
LWSHHSLHRFCPTFPGKSDAVFAIVAWDRLFVNEPGREISFVRE